MENGLGGAAQWFGFKQLLKRVSWAGGPHLQSQHLGGKDRRTSPSKHIGNLKPVSVTWMTGLYHKVGSRELGRLKRAWRVGEHNAQLQVLLGSDLQKSVEVSFHLSPRAAGWSWGPKGSMKECSPRVGGQRCKDAFSCSGGPFSGLMEEENSTLLLKST